MDQAPVARAARDQHDQVAQPHGADQEAGVDQHVVGEEEGPRPRGKVSHHGVRQRRGPEPGRASARRSRGPRESPPARPRPARCEGRGAPARSSRSRARSGRRRAAAARRTAGPAAARARPRAASAVADGRRHGVVSCAAGAGAGSPRRGGGGGVPAAPAPRSWNRRRSADAAAAAEAGCRGPGGGRRRAAEGGIAEVLSGTSAPRAPRAAPMRASERRPASSPSSPRRLGERGRDAQRVWPVQDQHVAHDTRLRQRTQPIDPLPAQLLALDAHRRVPTGTPRGYTPPRPEATTTAPSGRVSR